MAKVLVGLIAKQCAGKGTFIKLLRELLPGYTIGQNTSSESLTGFLNDLDVPRAREKYNALVEALEKFFEGPALSDKMRKIILRDPSKISVFDGMRLPSDFAMMRELARELKIRFVTVYITASDEICLERARARNEKSEEHKLTLEEFKKQQEIYTAKDICALGRKNADYIIVNEGGIDEYREEVLRCIRKKILPPNRWG